VTTPGINRVDFDPPRKSSVVWQQFNRRAFGRLAALNWRWMVYTYAKDAGGWFGRPWISRPGSCSEISLHQIHRPCAGGEASNITMLD